MIDIDKGLRAFKRRWDDVEIRYENFGGDDELCEVSLISYPEPEQEADGSYSAGSPGHVKRFRAATFPEALEMAATFYGDDFEPDELMELLGHQDRLLAEALEVIRFYGDPGTYFAIGFKPDPPSGDFIEDFEDTHMGYKPGKRARDFFNKVKDGARNDRRAALAAETSEEEG